MAFTRLLGRDEFLVCFVIVVELPSRQVFGHHVLDLKREYGVKG
jgi:hypothetical protein